MENSRNTKAVVLSRQDYRESDSLAVFYSLEYGKLSLIARGTKKAGSKLAGHVEPLSFVDLMVINGKRDYVGGVIAREQYLNLKQDLNALYFAGLGINWLRRLTEEGEADKEIFYLLLNYLEILDTVPSAGWTKEEGELLFVFFIFKFISEIGYKPEVGTCLSCHQKIIPGKNYFNLKNGGLVCPTCFKEKKEGEEREWLTISDNCVKLLRFILENELEDSKRLKIDKKLIKEISTLAKGFLNFRS